MNVGDLVRAMEAIAPSRFAAPWDNVGLIVGDEGCPLARVLVTIDCTADVLDEARRERAEAIVAYHPPIFAAAKRFLAGSIAHDAARAGVAIHSPHTALDVAEGGTNDVLADAIAMTGRLPLRPLEEAGIERRGMGRVGAVERAAVPVLVVLALPVWLTEHWRLSAALVYGVLCLLNAAFAQSFLITRKSGCSGASRSRE